VAIPYTGPAADAIPNALDALNIGIMAIQQHVNLIDISVLKPLAGPNAHNAAVANIAGTEVMKSSAISIKSCTLCTRYYYLTHA